MKKLMTLIAALVLGFSVLGCAEKKATPPANPPGPSTNDAPGPAPETPAPKEPAAPAGEEKK